MRIPSIWRGRVLLVVLFSVAGCGSKPHSAEVSGVVKLDGVPMPDALVEFLPDPDKGTHGPRSSGVTDAEGRFRLRFDDESDGAVVGFHRVLVQDVRTFPPPRNRQAKGPPLVMPPARISSRYQNATTSPLRHEVKAGSQTITLEVTSR